MARSLYPNNGMARLPVLYDWSLQKQTNKQTNPKDNVGRTPLHDAIKYNHTNVCKIILPLIRFK